MEEINFNSTYYFADLVESYIYGQSTFWNYYNRDIRKYGGDYIHYIFFFRNLFNDYKVDTNLFDNIEEDEYETNENILNTLNDNFEDEWHQHEDEFRELFNNIAADVFFILFGNRHLLLHFNNVVAESVEQIGFSDSDLTQKGNIKRTNIPQWVKKAIFSRDKGRCTICTKDLTGLIAVDQKQHYDHIVPLNLSGVNDPSNIQLLCESCNLKKSGNIIETSKLYVKWW